METIKLDDVKKLVETLENSGRKSAVTNVEFSEEGIAWLKENGYYSKTYKGFTAFSKSEASLPPDDELESFYDCITEIQEKALLEAITICTIIEEILLSNEY